MGKIVDRCDLTFDAWFAAGRASEAASVGSMRDNLLREFVEVFKGSSLAVFAGLELERRARLEEV